MIRKYLVCVVVSIFVTFVFGQAVELNRPSTMTSIDAESFSFTYIGHAFGAENDSSYWQSNTVDYPATALLSNISMLKQADFTIFGGDAVQRCFPEVFDALETSLLKRLDMPIFNSAGNQDFCFRERYNFDKTVNFVHGANLFLVISSEFEQLEEESQNWLLDKLANVLENKSIENVFVFTHRPLFLDFLPELQQAASLTNSPVKSDKETAETFLSVLDKFPQTQKNVYWLASDVGKNYPLVSHKYNDNVQFIASGLYDNLYDHVLNINVVSDSETKETEVTIDILSLGEHEFSVLEDYSYKWVDELVKRKANTSNSVSYLQSIRSGILGKFISIEELTSDVYEKQTIKGYVDWATYNPQSSILTIAGWAPIQVDSTTNRWFGYEGDFSLELQAVKTVARPDVAKIFGAEQLDSGFELSFKLLDSQADLMANNLCFFSQTDMDGIFVLPFNNNQQTFKCKVFP